MSDVVAISHIMTMSRNGQVSIPAAARARWGVRKLLVVDLGDTVVISPVLDDPIRELAGKYKTSGVSSEEMRREERELEAELEDREQELRLRARAERAERDASRG